MVKGMRSYSSKERRKVRRANHAARDLRGTPKYKQRIVEPKIHKDPKYKHKDFEIDDYDDNDS